MKTFSYPSGIRKTEEVFNQRLLDLTTSNLLSWKQGAGNFGALHLHACWGNSSVLQRRYHGQTVSKNYTYLKGMMTLFDHTSELQWLWEAEDIVVNILSTQANDGGFFHASNENEPTYTSVDTCPIAQAFPLLALLRYLEWPSANPRLIERTRLAVIKHIEWLIKHRWLKGNKMSGPLPKAGFCGVTNQDLTVVAALAQQAKIFNDDFYYRKYGKPTLDLYLSEKYYHEEIGLFERADQQNFVERTGYHTLILSMLDIIHQATEDSRLPAVMSNIREHFFDAIYEGRDGRPYIAWGCDIDPNKKGLITKWIQEPVVIAELLTVPKELRTHLEQYPNAERSKMVDRMEQTLTAYIFADGSFPYSLAGNDPLFHIAGQYMALWLHSMHVLGDKLESPKIAPMPCVNRSSGEVTWKINQTMWSVEVDGVRQFAGLKANPSGIALGQDESVAGANFSELDNPDILETVHITS